MSPRLTPEQRRRRAILRFVFLTALVLAVAFVWALVESYLAVALVVGLGLWGLVFLMYWNEYRSGKP